MSKGPKSRVTNHKAYRDCPLWDKGSKDGEKTVLSLLDINVNDNRINDIKNYPMEELVAYHRGLGRYYIFHNGKNICASYFSKEELLELGIRLLDNGKVEPRRSVAPAEGDDRQRRQQEEGQENSEAIGEDDE